MNLATFLAFEHEVRSITKTADAAGWKPPSIAPVSLKPATKALAAAPKHSPDVSKALGNLFKSYGTKAISKHGSVEAG